MWIELPALWIVVINCAGIPAVHLLVSWGMTRLPAAWFRGRSPLFHVRAWEKSLYERGLLLRRWKKRLPDAAPWFKGFPKAALRSTDPHYLRSFVAETRRGEFAHWVQWLLIAGFIAWNPYPANLVILAYGALSNLPCIASLRHTRLRMERLLDRINRG